MEQISDLLDQSDKARSSNNWAELEEISIKIFKTLLIESLPREDFLRKVVLNYLSSIVGTGEFLTDLSQQNLDKYQDGLKKLSQFLNQKQHKFESLNPLLNTAQEISLLATDPIQANRNKIAKHLRKIARPDISIIICQQILDKTRLNYYALTVLCGALCDLGEVDKAIDVAERVLKIRSEGGRTYILNSLVRAHTLKFKRTGDMTEIDTALSYGHESIDLKPDIYAANAFVAAAIASMYEREIEYAQVVLSKAEPERKGPDIAAMVQAYKILQASAPTADVVEVIDETSTEDELKFQGLSRGQGGANSRTSARGNT